MMRSRDEGGPENDWIDEMYRDKFRITPPRFDVWSAMGRGKSRCSVACRRPKSYGGPRGQIEPRQVRVARLYCDEATPSDPLSWLPQRRTLRLAVQVYELAVP